MRNGHEYAKRQLEREEIAYKALDNGIQSCANTKRLQAICDSLSAAKIDALLRKWLRRLPHPFPDQLRRLRLHGLIERIPKTHRYRLTSFGLRVAVFCTRTYSRILRPGLGLALPTTSSFPCSLRRSFDKLEQEVHSWVDQARLAA